MDLPCDNWQSEPLSSSNTVETNTVLSFETAYGANLPMPKDPVAVSEAFLL